MKYYKFIFSPKLIIMVQNTNQNKDVDPTKVKKWIAVIIAILSAIAGALGESATGFIGNVL